MVTSRIAPYGGVPTLFINDIPNPGMAYITYITDNNRYADFAAAGVKLFSVPIYFSEQPLNEYSMTPKFCEGIFENGEHFEILDREILRVLEACPDALIFPRINLSLPRKWELEHPDELCFTAVNTVDGIERRRACFASEAWARETERLLKRFIEYAQSRPWADSVIGWQIAGGNTDEWYSFDRKGSDGPRAREAFSDAVSRGEYTDTEPDYYRFLSKTVASRIERFAALVKQLTNERLVVGAFYGYTMECPYRESCHHAMSWLLRSPNVDFFCSPASYMDTRAVGIDHPNALAIDSVKEHGKLYFVENDTRTDLSRHPFHNHPYYLGPIWLGPGREDSVEIIKQHFARALLHGHAMWWFDMWGGWYDAPEYKALFPELEKIAEEALTLPRRSSAEAALFVDERSLSFGQNGGILYEIRRNLGLAGAAYDVYLSDDFDAAADRYKLCIFLNPAETELQQKAIAACRCAKEIVTAGNWLRTPGEWRELFASAGIPVRSARDAIVYENESWLFIGCEGDVTPCYDGELKPVWSGRSKLWRKISK